MAEECLILLGSFPLVPFHFDFDTTSLCTRSFSFSMTEPFPPPLFFISRSPGHRAAAAPGVALCREVEGYGSGGRPRGVGRAVGAVAAGFGL